ncbi:MAG: DNA polymerase III subunit delta' [Pseudolabrys sp.]
MSEGDDATGDIAHPRATDFLFGHEAAERAFLDGYRSGRLAHAWLIGGPPGIGKATLAYRAARFVLAHPNPSAPAVHAATSLAVAKDHPAALRIANEAHPDLLILQRTINEKTGKLHQNIIIDEIRRAVPFFGSTAGEGGWRVAIVDSVDELIASGANALLKILEEPPERALLLLVSNAPGRVLPTIRSRCRVLALRPLSDKDVARAAAAALGRPEIDAALEAAAAAAGGSVARAIALSDGKALALRQKIIDLLAQLPNPDQRSLHTLGDSLAAYGGRDPKLLAAFMDAVNGWMTAQLRNGPQDIQQRGRLAQTWEKINTTAGDVAEYNLDRKPLVFAVFSALADAARG